jgi:hypothetical protein
MDVDRETIATARDLIKLIAKSLDRIEDAAYDGDHLFAGLAAIQTARGHLDRLGSMFPVSNSTSDTVGETTDASDGSDDLSRQIADLDRQLANVAVIQGLVAKYFTQPDAQHQTDKED